MKKLKEYLQKRSVVNKETNCWEWDGGLDSWGYGQFFKNRKTHKAHRSMYKEVHGDIPKGMFVCHTCDNPKCINPEHLWLGTPKQNANDRDQKGRHHTFHGEEHPQAKLNWDLVNMIRKNPHKYTQKKLAHMCGVSISTIKDVIYNKCWKNDDDIANTLRKNQATS